MGLDDVGEELRYFVLERLGSSLDKVHRPMAKAQLGCVGEQLVTILERLHRRGLVHCDVNPENVCWAWTPDGGDDASSVRIIDLGMVKKVQGRPQVGCQAGKPNFVGTHYFRGEIYSFRDDLEAVGLIVADLCGAALPWAKCTYPKDLQAMLKLREESPDKYLNGSPSKRAIAEYLKVVQGLEGGKTPTIDYDALRGMFTKLRGGSREGAGCDQ